MKLIVLSLTTLLAISAAKPQQRPIPRQQRPTPRQAATCGAIPSFMTTTAAGRIVGGQAAESPIGWQVSVRQCQSGGCHFCGGTILDATTVMSAAHCFTTGQSMSGFYITAGVKNRNDNSGQTIEIANGVWNADMPYQGNNNDFVILKLSSALSFNANVYPACLPDADHAPEVETPAQTCFVSGWGTLESGANSLPTALQWVAVPTVTNGICSQQYGGGITSSMICAGSPNGGIDSCQGDSGGPFICTGPNGQGVLTGVVSFGVGCGLASHSGVYARTTAVLDWIKANMDSGTAPPPGPTTQGPPPSPTPSACIDEWIEDGYCDDENNSAACQFDGGDCCNNDMPNWDWYCSDCACIVGDATTCEVGVPHWVGDNYCDDENNNVMCGFDGGDCCNNDMANWDWYCNDCQCLG